MDDTHILVPFADEAALAQLAFHRWEQQNAESMAEYIYRRRTVDLAALLPQAIEEELSEKQKALIRMRYYENRTPAEIARRTDQHLSSVTRTLHTAEGRLYRVLRYVVEYQNGLKETTLLPLPVRRAMAVCAARNSDPRTLGERLHVLRMGDAISIPALARSVGIPQARYAAIESAAALPDADELLHLAAFFDISLDVLLKGAKT